MADNQMSEFVDPALRQAVQNMTKPVLEAPVDPNIAQQKGFLKIEKPPEYSYGTAMNDAVIKRAKERLYDPNISEGMQKYRYAMNQGDKLQNASNQIMNIYKLDRQAEQIIRERKAAEDAQRASVLGSVLGVAGAVAGAYFAGPTGAVVGGQLGQTVAKGSTAQTRSAGE